MGEIERNVNVNAVDVFAFCFNQLTNLFYSRIAKEKNQTQLMPFIEQIIDGLNCEL